MFRDSALVNASKNLGTKVRKFSAAATGADGADGGAPKRSGGGLLAAAAAARALGPGQ